MTKSNNRRSRLALSIAFEFCFEGSFRNALRINADNRKIEMIVDINLFGGLAWLVFEIQPDRRG